MGVSKGQILSRFRAPSGKFCETFTNFHPIPESCPITLRPVCASAPITGQVVLRRAHWPAWCCTARCGKHTTPTDHRCASSPPTAHTASPHPPHPLLGRTRAAAGPSPQCRSQNAARAAGLTGRHFGHPNFATRGPIFREISRAARARQISEKNLRNSHLSQARRRAAAARRSRTL